MSSPGGVSAGRKDCTLDLTNPLVLLFVAKNLTQLSFESVWESTLTPDGKYENCVCSTRWFDTSRPFDTTSRRHGTRGGRTTKQLLKLRAR